MSDEAKDKWITKLTEVHQLCKDGKDEEASRILTELNKDKEWDTVFSTYDSNLLPSENGPFSAESRPRRDGF